MRAAKKTVLLIQPSLDPPGGGNGLAAWMLQALRGEYDLTLLSWRAVDVEATNRYFGTSLGDSDFSVVLPFAALRWLLDRIPVPLTLLKMQLLVRRARLIRRGYDLLISASNEADLGGPGIQYVHFPAAFLPRPAVDLRWYHGWAAALDVYRRLCRKVSDHSTTQLKNNLTLVNSHWTGDKVRTWHGIESITVYPPIAGDFTAVPWTERENGFVCIGRFSPEKEFDKVIDIIAALRARGHDTHLHLVGGLDARSSYYHAHVVRRVAENPSWLFLHEDLSRAELVDLIAHHRYGIHGMSEEHFGMAVAEMVRGGCVVFVPRGGGQVEIVGGEDRLLYRTQEEAVEKITATLKDTALQLALCRSLQKQTVLFSMESFTAQMRALVRDFLNGGPRG
ncbi:MAG TPA: glycosyltransferase [Candidatus Binatia bacterium]|jgi:glycosyltransferase involved in cell wall biosynthesis